MELDLLSSFEEYIQLSNVLLSLVHLERRPTLVHFKFVVAGVSVHPTKTGIEPNLIISFLSRPLAIAWS